MSLTSSKKEVIQNYLVDIISNQSKDIDINTRLDAIKVLKSLQSSTESAYIAVESFLIDVISNKNNTLTIDSRMHAIKTMQHLHSTKGVY